MYVRVCTDKDRTEKHLLAASKKRGRPMQIIRENEQLVRQRKRATNACAGAPAQSAAFTILALLQ